MSLIRDNLIKNGTVPIMSEEGTGKLLNYYVSLYSRKDRKVADPSRVIKLSGFKEPVDRDRDEEAEIQCRFNIFKYNLDKIRKEVLTNRDEFESLLNSGEILSESHATIEDVNEILSMDLNSVYTALKTGNIDSLPKFARYILDNLAHTSGEHQGSFERLPFKTDHKSPLPYDHRIYLNTPTGPALYEFFDLYAKKCIQKGIPYDIKPGFNVGTIDRTILYAHDEHLDTVLEILEEIKRERPNLIAQFGSPISTACNYSYYGVCHAGVGLFTYNAWFNNVSEDAFMYMVAQEIGKDSRYLSTLDSNTQSVIRKICNPETLKEIIPKFDPKTAGKNNVPLRLKSQQLFDVMKPEQYDSFCNAISAYVVTVISKNPEKYNGEFNLIIKQIAALNNFGDMSKVDVSVCFRDGFISEEKMIETPKIASEEKREVKQSENEKLLPDMQQVKFDNNAIFVMCASKAELRIFLSHHGVSRDEARNLTREQMEEKIIEIIGIDRIVAASSRVKEKEKGSSLKLMHRYENTLQAMRSMRGKRICKCMEAFKTPEQKEQYLETLSPLAVEDAKVYFSTIKNLETSFENMFPALQ